MTEKSFSDTEEQSLRLKLQREHLDYGNADLARIGRSDIHWVLRNGQVRLERR